MKRYVTAFATIITFFLCVFLSSSSAVAAEKYIRIGTAGITGVYFPAGGAVCRMFNRNKSEHGIRCYVEPTGGSIENIHMLRENELDFAIVQSDWQFHAYRGDGIFSELGPFEGLRSVFSIHSEAFTVMVRADSPIQTFNDLKGKRVNIGNPGSGMRATMEEVMRMKGWTNEIFSHVSELKATEQTRALCDSQVDAIVYSGGHPNGAVQEVTAACPTRIIPLEEADIDTFVKSAPFYAYAIIPGGMYPNNPNDIPTFGVKATLVTVAQTDEQAVYQLVRAVFDNLDSFKTLHPVFSTLSPVHMVHDGNTVPLHPGAERYFAEQNLLNMTADTAPFSPASEPVPVPGSPPVSAPAAAPEPAATQDSSQNQ